MLKIGICKVDITPREGLGSGAYFSADGISGGVHDKLFARILAVNDNSETAIIIVCDLIALLGEHVQKIRASISSCSGINPHKIMIATTHTHSSPDTMNLFHEIDPAYINELAQNITNGVLEALSNTQECRLSVRKCEMDGVSRNRRIKMKDGSVQAEWWKPDPKLIAGPGGPVDTILRICRIESVADRRPIAVLVNYPCHQTVTHSGKQYSADFAGLAMNYIEQKTGVPAYYFNGACGDINPAVNASGFQEAERLGKLIAERALALLKDEDWKTGTSSFLVIKQENLKFEWRDLPSLEDAMERVSKLRVELEKIKSAGGNIIAFNQPELRRAENLVKILKNGEYKKKIETEMQLIKFGDIKLISIPGEFFTQLGMDIAKGDKNIWLTSNTNDYIGYIPVQTAYAEGGYEVIPWRLSKLKPGTGEKIRDAALRLLKDN